MPRLTMNDLREAMRDCPDTPAGMRHVRNAIPITVIYSIVFPLAVAVGEVSRHVAILALLLLLAFILQSWQAAAMADLIETYRQQDTEDV